MKQVVVATLVIVGCIAARTVRADAPWTQLSLSACQVDAYLKANPEWDGRGVVVAVLDTGVDPSIPGLMKTSTGEIKVVDVQDFSGQGDIDIVRALWGDAGDKIVRYNAKGEPEYYVPPHPDARGEGRTIWFGVLQETLFKNSAVSDVNDNGKKDDVFAICIIAQDNGLDDDAVCYIDLDLDRDFSNERPLKNYKLNQDAFVFPRDKKEKQIEPLTMEINIFLKKRKIVFHFDDGGHGTHVAGIAAGYQIQGQAGFNGVAPGAHVISLKIGNNSLAGGASTTGSIKSALQYAGRYAKEHNCIVVCNLSFGIGSMLEGHTSIDKFVDSFLQKNPRVVFCTSAGNEGPGLSTVGTPAAAPAAISVGALWAADTARDVQGMQQEYAQLTDFSSRGGEIDKPDIVTPGMMTSTVPKWTKGGDFWGGTSMASPYAAGMCALLANHVQAKHGVLPRSDWIKRALKRSGRALPGYSTLDFGAGLPIMSTAADAIDRMVEKSANDPLFAFSVTTNSPMTIDGTGPTAYWRTTHFPTDRPQSFTVKPVFAPTVDATIVNAFSRRLMLRSDADWCKLLQDQIYFRNTQSATVRVEYDAGKLKEPGIYVATVEGLDDGEVALRLINTIIVPHRFSAANGYGIKLENQSVSGLMVKRYFFAVPAGASAMNIKLSAVDGKPSTVRARHIHRPDGIYISRGYPLRLDVKNDLVESSYTVEDELTPGVWELPVVSGKTDEDSFFTLEVRFDGIQAEPTTITDLSADPGSKPSGTVKLINAFERPMTITTSGKIEGYRKTVTKKASPDKDVVKVDLTLSDEIEGMRILLKTSDKDYLKFTDCAVSAFDASGKAISQGGFSEPWVTMSFDNPDPSSEATSVSLEIQPAFTHINVEDEVEFEIVMDYLYADPIDVHVARGENTEFKLYPGIPTELSWELYSTPPEAPEGTSTLGYVRAVERTTKKRVMQVEILDGEE